MFVFTIFFYNCIDISNYSSNERAYSNVLYFFEISYCDFIRTTVFSNGGGGSIYLVDQESYLNIFHCLFLNCSTLNSHGGAILFLSTSKKSNLSIKSTCGSYCFVEDTNSYGNFAQIQFRTDFFDLIKFDFLSINYCSYSTLKSRSAIYLNHGNQSINNFNSSKNSALGQTGITLGYPDSVFLLFCTFFGNNGNNCLDLYKLCTHLLVYLNIVEKYFSILWSCLCFSKLLLLFSKLYF